MKKLLFCFLLAIFGFCFVACNEKEDDNNDDNNQVQAPVLNITETSIDLKVGETFTFNVDIDVLMESSKASVVTVNEATKTITAVGAGEATVTVYALADTTVSKSITVKVTEKEAPVKPELNFTETAIDLDINDTYTFDVDIEVILETSNSAVVTVDSANKKITASGVGDATVTVYAKEDTTVSKSVVVTVTDPNAEVKINPETIEITAERDFMYLEETMQLTCKVLPEGANQEVKWVTADTSAIDLDQTGLITAKVGRTVSIKVTSVEDKSVSAVIQIQVKNYIDPDPFFSNFVVEKPVTEIVYAFGWAAGTTWEAKLNGSVTKYMFDKITVTQAYISTSLPERPGTFMKARFIVFHDTAGASAGENAAWTASYCNTPTDSSWHFNVDSEGIYQTMPMNEVAWHAGCGTDIDLTYTDTKIPATSKDPAKVTISSDGYFEMNGTKTTIKAPLKDDGNIPTNENIPYTGIENYVNEKTGTYWLANTWWSKTYQHVGNYGGNNEGIGIESCVNNGNDIWKTWANAAKLIGSVIMPYTGLAPKDVRQHNSFSGKDCPMTMRHADKWEEFIELITYEYAMYKYFGSFDVKFICDSPYINSNGLVKSLPEVETQIPCQIKVTNAKEGYDKTFDFTVTLGNEYTKNLNNTAPTYMQRFN